MSVLNEKNELALRPSQKYILSEKRLNCCSYAFEMIYHTPVNKSVHLFNSSLHVFISRIVTARFSELHIFASRNVRDAQVERARLFSAE
jgi:hypothetical protein